MRFAAAAAVVFLCTGMALAAGEPETATPTAALRASEDGVVRAEGIRIDVRRRQIAVDGWVSVASSTVRLEYLATSERGKLYESLLGIRCDPEKLQLGLLLLGIKPRAELSRRGQPLALSAERVRIDIAFTGADGGEKVMRIEDMLIDTYYGKTMPHVGFAFSGSRFLGGSQEQAPKLAAALTGNALALYHDPDAILNYPLLGGGDVPLFVPTFQLTEVVGWVAGDERFVANAEHLPERGTKVVLRLSPLASEPASSSTGLAPGGTEAPAPTAGPGR